MLRVIVVHNSRCLWRGRPLRKALCRPLLNQELIHSRSGERKFLHIAVHASLAMHCIRCHSLMLCSCLHRARLLCFRFQLELFSTLYIGVHLHDMMQRQGRCLGFCLVGFTSNWIIAGVQIQFVAYVLSSACNSSCSNACV